MVCSIKLGKKKLHRKSKLSDLHIHTNHSDGILSSVETINTAVEVGLCCISVTDHDTVDALGVCIPKGVEMCLEVIPGVELTSHKDKEEIHILGYFIDWENSELLEILNKRCLGRINRIKSILEKLEKFNIFLKLEDVVSDVSIKAVGRLHVARVLVQKGYVSKTAEAFEKYIGNDKPCYVPNLKVSPQETIDLVRNFGGVPILAHPRFLQDDKYILELKKSGLKGVEAFHPDHSLSVMKHYVEFAKDNELLITGGSDSHGCVFGGSNSNIGRITINYEYVERLREAVSPR